MSDDEWAFFEPFVTTRGAHSGRRPRDHRRVLDGIFWIARTGVQWRDLPDFFGKWSSVYRQFRRWTLSGLWDLLLEVLNDTEGVGETVQMIDSTVIRAHHCAAGARGGLRKDRRVRSYYTSIVNDLLDRGVIDRVSVVAEDRLNPCMIVSQSVV